MVLISGKGVYVIMKFEATVTLVDTPANQAKQQDTDKAKQLILEAFQILAKHDSSIMNEAEEFLKGVEV